MKVIPSIDLLDGKVVRLRQGKRGNATIYSKNPEDTAKKLVDQGAKLLHVVDLDAAFDTGDNLSAIDAITRAVTAKGASIQAGGGIRSTMQAGRLFALGVERVFIGTAALDPDKLRELTDKYGERVWAACEISQGKACTNGWTDQTNTSDKELLEKLSRSGVGGILATDVSGDGMLVGASLTFFERIARLTGLPRIAAGGVTTLNDLRALKWLGYEGAIIGKALYENKLDLKEALEVVKDAS